MFTLKFLSKPTVTIKNFKFEGEGVASGNTIILR